MFVLLENASDNVLLFIRQFRLNNVPLMCRINESLLCKINKIYKFDGIQHKIINFNYFTNKVPYIHNDNVPLLDIQIKQLQLYIFFSNIYSKLNFN